MPFSISIPEFGIDYKESDEYNLYIAVARMDDDGNGDTMIIAAKDEFTAGIAAKSMCKKVLKLDTLEHMLLRLQDVVKESMENAPAQ